MAVIMKTIGKTKYAYLTYREGRRIVQQYLGPSKDPAVAKIVSRIKEVKNMPEDFKVFFWDTDIRKLRVKEHAKYIIERLLELGDLDSMLWLQRAYPTQTIINILNTSRKLSAKSSNFWSIWFGVDDA